MTICTSPAGTILHEGCNTDLPNGIGTKTDSNKNVLINSGKCMVTETNIPQPLQPTTATGQQLIEWVRPNNVILGP